MLNLNLILGLVRIRFHGSIESIDSAKWIDAINDELKSMKQNEVWDLIELPQGYKKVGLQMSLYDQTQL